MRNLVRTACFFLGIGAAYLNHFPAHNNLAGVLVEFGEIAEVVAHCTEAVRLSRLLRCFSFGSPIRCPTCPANAPLPQGKESIERWQLDLGGPISRMITADLKGDGRMGLLFGGGDGRLHAVGEWAGKPWLLWSVAEVRRRLEAIVEKLRGGWKDPSPDRRRTLRVVETLEQAGTPEAGKELQTLAGGVAEARLTQEAKRALARLARRPTAR
jgi:hypothetical protein